MAFFRKIKAGLVKSEIAEYIGEEGNIFFNIDTGELRLSDGITPGGLPIYAQGTGGNGVSLNVIGSVPLQTDLDVAHRGAVGDTLVVQNTGNFWLWSGDQWIDIGVVQAPQGYTGSQGDVGFTGSQGGQGEQGRIGFTGSQGEQGIIGYTGSRGEIGFTGSKGDRGDVGYTGSQGIIGFTGSQGDIGFTGSQGDIGFTGSQGDIGFTGSQGDIGFTGSQGDIGYTGSQGDTGFTGSQGDTGFTGSQGAGFTGSQGDVGFVGSQGDIGFTGSQGAGFTGSQGDVGYTGSVGFTGSQGDIGYTGSQGDVGFTGSQGDIGYTGSQGDIGYTGSQGDVGYAGSVGYTGSQGDIGYTGSQGDTGMGFQIAKIYVSVADLTADVSPTDILVGEFAVIETGNNDDPENSRLYLWNGTAYSYITDLSGAVGLTGAKGDTGYTGSAGVDGSVGYTGSFGDTGYTGSVGYTGSAGVDGSVGYTGSFGDTGYTGSIGYTGSAVPGMVSDGSGIITIETGYSIVPATDGLQSLGSPTAAWGEIYISGNSIYLGGNVISINADGSLDITDSAGDAIPVRAKNFYIGSVGMPAYTQGTDITGLVFPDGSLQTTSAPKMYTNADAANGLSLSDLKPGDYYYDDVNASIYICYDTGLGYFDILDLTVRAS